MLHDFLEEHRQDLIARTEAKAKARPGRKATQEDVRHGVPLFLTQLGAALRAQAATQTPVPNRDISAGAVSHGQEMLRIGFTLSQVVHGYGDVCQAVTELAGDLDVPITVHEFHTLNRALDDAIADSVTEYARQRDSSLGFQQRELICAAILAWQMLTRGIVGTGGNTAALLTRSLESLRKLSTLTGDMAPIPDPGSAI